MRQDFDGLTGAGNDQARLIIGHRVARIGGVGLAGADQKLHGLIARVGATRAAQRHICSRQKIVSRQQPSAAATARTNDMPAPTSSDEVTPPKAQRQKPAAFNETARPCP